MGILVQLEASAKPECISELNRTLAEIFPETRLYDGCIDITAYLNEDDQTVLFIEHWESKKHYEKYLAWREETGALTTLASFFQGPPVIRYFDTIEA